MNAPARPIPRPKRLYLSGNTYPLREEIRAAGGRWDPQRKQWWVTPDKRPAMQALAAKARTLRKRSARHAPPADDQRVIGRGIHAKDRSPVFIAWMGRAKATGQLLAKLVDNTGTRTFWAPAKDVQMERRFDQPLPLSGLLAAPALVG